MFRIRLIADGDEWGCLCLSCISIRIASLPASLTGLLFLCIPSVSLRLQSGLTAPRHPVDKGVFSWGGSLLLSGSVFHWGKAGPSFVSVVSKSKNQVSVMTLAQRWKHPWATILIQDRKQTASGVRLGEEIVFRDVTVATLQSRGTGPAT